MQAMVRAGDGSLTLNAEARERLVGRVAARLHAADLKVHLSSEEAHVHWLSMSQAQRDHWTRLARVVVLYYDDDTKWAASL